MMRANVLLVAAISLLLAVGAWGVSGWSAKPERVLRNGQGREEALSVLAVKVEELNKQVEDRRGEVELSLRRVLKLEMLVESGAVRGDFGDLQNGTAGSVTGVLSELKTKAAAFVDNVVPSGGMREPGPPYPEGFDSLGSIKPRAGENFHVEFSGARIDLVWVPFKNAGTGFWITAKEMATPPPSALPLKVDSVDLGRNLKCRMPKDEERLAADKQSPTVETAAPRRGIISPGAVSAEVSETGEKLMAAFIAELGKSRTDMLELIKRDGLDVWKQALKVKRQRAANMTPANNNAEPVRYRWVIDAPLP